MSLPHPLSIINPPGPAAPGKIPQQIFMPQMPELTRGSQFKGWAASLIQALRLVGLANYILNDPTDLVKTARGKPFAMVLMTASTMEFSSELEQAGWDPYQVEQNPKDFFDLVKKVVMDEGWEQEAEKHLDVLDVKQDATLLEFRQRLETIKAHMPARMKVGASVESSVLSSRAAGFGTMLSWRSSLADVSLGTGRWS